MKTIVKVILPVLAFTLASAAAVSTNETKIKESKKVVLITAFIQNSSPQDCESKEVNCTTVNTQQACMTSESPSRQAWNLDESSSCNVTLYKKIN